MPDVPNYKDFYSKPESYHGDKGAGCIFVAKDTGRILLAHRAEHGDVEEPGTWATWGGKIDGDENPRQTVAREVEEETGYTGIKKIQPLYVYRDGDFEYHNFLVVVPFEFTPQLNWENDSSTWVEYGQWPEPLHFGLQYLLQHSGAKIKNVIDLLKQKRDNLSEMDMPPAQIQPASTNATVAHDMTNAYLVAATIWGEARSEGQRGMQAVLNVIMNRAHHDFSKAKDVILKNKQFTIWNSVPDPVKYSQDLAAKERTPAAEDLKQYQMALTLVDNAMHGKVPDITAGATYYFNKDEASPSWEGDMTPTTVIGKHTFFKPKKHVKEASAITTPITVKPEGVIDIGVFGYKIQSPYSYVSYGYEPDARVFHLYMVQTPKDENRNMGHAKEVLKYFFGTIRQKQGSLDVGPYTTSGENYLRHVLVRMAQEYNVRLV